MLEFGCGTGLLTRELIAAGHRVIATDASPAMIEIARAEVGGSAEDDWAVITEFTVPAPDRLVRDITTFVRNADGSWRRDREHHENVLLDTAQIPALLSQHGVEARVGPAFGSETLPQGLRAITGHRPNHQDG